MYRPFANVQPWSPTVRIPSTIAHVTAIIITIFRLLYRWHLSKFWWEDTWAILALICDIACLVSLWLQRAPAIPFTTPRIDHESGWLFALAITSVVWFARMSILCSIVRIANPAPKLRWIAYCIGVLFLAMEVGLLAQKIFICAEDNCRFTCPVGVAQLVNVISDTILVAIPAWFLHDVRLPRDRRILIISVFSASLLITVITTLHCILLFQRATNLTITIGHIKGAFALLLCNALVLVTLAYRLWKKQTISCDCPVVEGHCDRVDGKGVEFTSVIDLPSKLSSCILPAMSTPAAVQSMATAHTTLGAAPAGPESGPSSHAEKVASFRGAEDAWRDGDCV